MEIKEADELLRKVFEVRTLIQEQEVMVKKNKEELEHLENKFRSFLVQNNREEYGLRGVGTVYLVTKQSVATPKTLEDKRAFFIWVERQLGKDVADGYMSVNSQSLNALWKELAEEYAMNGQVLTIDGIGMPTSYTTFNFRKG